MKWLQIMMMSKMMMVMPIVKMLKLLKLAQVLDRLVNLKYPSKEERNSLVAMKFKLEKIRVLNKKQTMIGFTSSILRNFKLQQFNIISFFFFFAQSDP